MYHSGPNTHTHTHTLKVTLSVILGNMTSLNIFLLDPTFDKSTFGLHFLHIPSMIEKFPDDQTLVTMSSFKCLDFKFLYFKIMYKR